jgi:hypothetical protein
MLVKLNVHCGNIARALAAIENTRGWDHVIDWLFIGASVTAVHVDTTQSDMGFGYCSSTDEFFASREQLLQSFVTRLSVFTFAWGALEAALEIIRPPQHPDKSKRGKIRNACHYMARYFEFRPAVQRLAEEVDAFRSSAAACFGYRSVETRFSTAGDVGLPGLGLFVVYELRNSFAHGSLVFPMPDEENRPISKHSDLVDHATRIVLLTLQMLLLAHFDESEEKVYFSWSLAHMSGEYPLALLLRGCHMERSSCDNQLSLLDEI